MSGRVMCGGGGLEGGRRSLLPRPVSLITGGDKTVTQQHSTGCVVTPSGRRCDVWEHRASLTVMERIGTKGV